DLVAEVFQPQRRIVGAAVGRLAEPDLHDLSDEDGVIALLDRRLERALDEGGRVGEDRRARRPGTERLARDPVALQLGRLEEREGERLLSLAQDVQGERLVLLDEGVSVRVSLDADRDEGRLERCLGHPVHRGRGHLSVRVHRLLLGAYTIPHDQEATMPLTELNHYFVRANDLEQTKKFYCDVLGFEVRARPTFPFPGYWLGVKGKMQVHMGQEGVDDADVYSPATPT